MSAIPNLISLARLLIAPYIFSLLLARDYRPALTLFAVAGFSDFLDGWLARKLNAHSRAGAMLDPVADKVLQAGTYIVLAITGIIPWWLALLVLGRDILIVGFAAVTLLQKTRSDFPPSAWGKWSTAAQILFVLAAVGAQAGVTSALFVSPLLWITAGLTLWSGIDYARRAI